MPAATPIAPHARALLTTKNGSALFVAHATGSVVTIAETAAGMPTRVARFDYRDHVYRVGFEGGPLADEPRFAGQGFSFARIDAIVAAPMIVAYPGDPFLETPGYGPA